MPSEIASSSERNPTKVDIELIHKAYTGKNAVDLVKRYIAECKDNVQDRRGATNVVKLPKVSGLAEHLGIASTTLSRWAKTSPYLQEALQMLTDSQHNRLIDNSLSGNYNSQISKLILTKHGYHDKSEVTNTASEQLTSAIEQIYDKLDAAGTTKAPEDYTDV